MSLCRAFFEADGLELASGILFGRVPWIRRPPDAAIPSDPLRALEDTTLRSLLRPPCVISFSGGRDSSVVLAVAAKVARREGLPLPVPATNVFAGVESAAESEWQEEVIRHLGLDDWVRLELDEELDCVGPAAQSILARHGLLWPFNVHFHAPLLEVARGGSLLTGIGGDELLGTAEWARAAMVLRARARPTRRDPLRVGVALSPPAVRRLVLARRRGGTFSWLTEEANRRFLRGWGEQLSTEPLRWSRRWSWWRGLRQAEIGLRSLDLVAADHDVAIRHPLADPTFALAAGRRAASRRIYDRTSVLLELFGGLLPASVLSRASKASFDDVFWGGESRRIARDVLESPALDEIPEVDRAALRRVWTGEETPDAHSFLLLQALWLRSAGLASAPSFRAVARRQPAA